MSLSKPTRERDVHPCKGICLTLPNPTEVQVEWLIALSLKAGRAHELFKFVVCQLEKGGNTGLVHVQAYFLCHRPVRYTSKLFKRLVFCDGRMAGHCNVAMGSPAQNLQYCTKEDTRCSDRDLLEYFGCADPADDKAVRVLARGAGPWVGGVRPSLAGGGGGGAGQRSDLNAFTRRAAEGATNAELLEEFPGAFLRYSKHVEAVRLAAAKPVLTLEALMEGKVKPPEVIVMQGPTGSGKSHAALVEALTRYEADEIYECEAQRKLLWHDALTPKHKVMIIHEEVPYSYRQWLQITDRWGWLFPRRGVPSLRHKFELIIVASTLDWRTWYKAGETALGEFARRITEVRRMFEWRCVEVERGPFGLDGRPVGVAIAPPPSLPPPPPAGEWCGVEVGGNSGPPTSGRVPPGHFAPVAPAPVGVSRGGGGGEDTFHLWLKEQADKEWARSLKRKRDAEVPSDCGSPVYINSDDEEEEGEPGGARSPPSKKPRQE